MHNKISCRWQKDMAAGNMLSSRPFKYFHLENIFFNSIKMVELHARGVASVDKTCLASANFNLPAIFFPRSIEMLSLSFLHPCTMYMYTIVVCLGFTRTHNTKLPSTEKRVCGWDWMRIANCELRMYVWTYICVYICNEQGKKYYWMQFANCM